MSSFLAGIAMGFLLAILVGPIIIALIQVGIEKGFKAGIMVASGVWLSDLLFIIFAYFGIAYLLKITAWSGFEMTMGIAGGIILILFGAGAYFSKKANVEAKQVKSGKNQWLSLFSLGFLINTANPFTFFFWIGVITTYIPENGIEGYDTLYFLSGIYLTIIATDIAKVLLAKQLRKILTPKHVLKIRKVAGVILALFGVLLVIRVCFQPNF